MLLGGLQETKRRHIEGQLSIVQDDAVDTLQPGFSLWIWRADIAEAIKIKELIENSVTITEE